MTDGAPRPYPGPAETSWRLVSFADLAPLELDAIYRARQQVFVIEQQCIYLDADGLDRFALHLGAWSSSAADGAILCAYARILPPGARYAEPSIGRVLTTGGSRGTGLGRMVFGRAVEACRAAHPGQAIRISAQARLEAFYRGFGFAAIGAPYDEDGIAHQEMLHPVPTASG